MLLQATRTFLSRSGQGFQIFFVHDKDRINSELEQILAPAQQTAKRLMLSLDDLLRERIVELSKYCSSEAVYFAIWTRPFVLTKAQLQQSAKEQIAAHKTEKVPSLQTAQKFLNLVPEIREQHDSIISSLLSDLNAAGISTTLLDIHTACRTIRETVDPEFTDTNWQPSLPGDKLPCRETKSAKGDVSDILWPPLATQLIPRDGELMNLRTARIGDRLYSTVCIDLFPVEIAPFDTLFQRMLQTKAPWRISFLLESGGLDTLKMKATLASFLSFAHIHNRLLANANDLLKYIQANTDDAIVRLRVAASTWAPVGDEKLLRTRTAELSRALQGWGYCEVSEISGDPYAGALSSALGLSLQSVASTTVAPLSDATYLLPFTRPASFWPVGAVLFRTPDGKTWPYQPGSSQQTTWIDLFFARPGSGKSVLSNAINLALCLSSGIQRLPQIAIIDIGPSSSGLISLIKEALPQDKRHLAAYHRLRMHPDMSINPFDTQLGARVPTPLERAFLVNFLTLLATPIGQDKTYDGISDMAGLIIDELYKNLSDGGAPHCYTANLEPKIDALLSQLKITLDTQTTWWEITDALFKAGYPHEAGITQRYAMPILADAASACRNQFVEDLYGAIKTPTGEPLINAFGRMISSAVREYPILSRITAFDLGEARIVSLDLDEVAKTGGETADRQTAVVYMLARYVLARHYYLTEDVLKDLNPLYQDHHKKRILEIHEDPKRLVMDEFHRTSKAKAVRDQVLVDMREGRKWKVQVALLSQSLDDFDPIMIEFATSIFIMDAGPKQAVERTTAVFGLSPTAKNALETRVHGPRSGGSTFLSIFSTKLGVHTQLLTSTIGPIELWAFNTTAEDTRIRNALYEKIGAAETRRLLAMLYPSGSAARVVEERLALVKKEGSLITEEKTNGVIDDLIEEIAQIYKNNAVST